MNNSAREDLTRLLRNHGLKDVLYVLCDVVGDDIQTLLATNRGLDHALKEARETVQAAMLQVTQLQAERDALLQSLKDLQNEPVRTAEEQAARIQNNVVRDFRECLNKRDSLVAEEVAAKNEDAAADAD